MRDDGSRPLRRREDGATAGMDDDYIQRVLAKLDRVIERLGSQGGEAPGAPEAEPDPLIVIRD